ncbi:MAG: OmpA family protein [Verrucomicrobiota bacterium]
MNRLVQSSLLVLLMLGALGAAGCKRKPKNITPMPGYETAGGTQQVELPGGAPVPGGGRFGPGDAGGGRDLGGPGGPGGPGGELPGGDIRNGMVEDRTLFAGNVVYFEFDRSAVRKGERAKIAAVGEYLKSNPRTKMLLEGHCDERGTDGYNLALGERRALSVREELLNLGVESDRLQTITFGESRPADPGHDESAWSKNRRAEFILLNPAPGGVR